MSWLRRLPGGLPLGLAVASVVLWTGLRAPRTRLLGNEALDTWSHAWGIRWVYDALSQGSMPWRVDGLAWPEGGVLWYIDPLGALVSLPFQAIWGTAAGHNAILFVQVVLATWAGWAFARALGGQGWLAGVAMGTAPTFLAEIHNGTVEACWIGLVPLAAWAAARRSPWAGVLVGLAATATPYHGVSAALLVATLLWFEPHRTKTPGGTGRSLGDWRSRMRRLAMAGGLAIVVTLPSFLAMRASLEHSEGIARKPPAGENFPVFRINAVDPQALVQPGDFWSVPLGGPLETPFRRTPYLGLGLLVLAGAGTLRRRRHGWLWLPASACVILALGPYLWHDGDWVRTADGSMVGLPFRWLLLGLGISMDHPLRFVGGAIAVLAAMADRFLSPAQSPSPQTPSTRWRLLAISAALAVSTEHLLVAPSVWPLDTSDAVLPQVYRLLPQDGTAVIDLPADRGESIATNRYLYWHALHGRALPYAHKVSSQGFPSFNAALRTWTAAG
ncbi:MAG: hypothetical protein QGG40_11440, partial [Myxococcota bacterium]|nr:hypothetical protein [Myxococcota bacterium]